MPPPVLDYASLQRSRRLALGGLWIMGIFLIVVPGLFTAAILIDLLARPRFSSHVLTPLAFYSGLAVCGTLYCALAILMKRGVLWASTLALIVVACQAMALAAFFGIGIYREYGWAWLMPLLLTILGLLVETGMIALLVELARVRRGLRDGTLPPMSVR